MPANKLRPPYRQRILAYCSKHSVYVPPGFHSRNAEKYAIVDITAEPYSLIAVTSYLKSEVISYVTDTKNSGRNFKILDFQRCCELQISEQRKLIRGESFQCKTENELLYLVAP